METSLETVALFSLKLAYETEGQSPILRDDLVMGDYQKDVFALLVRNSDVEAIQQKIAECMKLAMNALGGEGTVMGRELQKLSTDVDNAQTIAQMAAPLALLKDYLKAIQ